MNRFFPELVAMLQERKDGPFVADGEIVLVRPGSLVRRAPAAVASGGVTGPHAVGRDPGDADPLRPPRGRRRRSHEPWAERRERLAKLCARLDVGQAPQDLDDLEPGPDLLLTPWTEDLAAAQEWFADEAGLGQDGIIASGPTSRTCAARGAG